MFLLPVLVLVIAGVVAWRLLHRQPHAVGTTAGAPGTVAAVHGPVWPTTLAGWLGIGAFVFVVVAGALVNVVQVPFLTWILLLAAVVLTGVARFAGHDHSTAVLVVFVVTAIGAAAAVLFLAGEVFIGHD